MLRTCCVGSRGCDSESALTGENRVHQRQTLSVDSVWFAKCRYVREGCLPRRNPGTTRVHNRAHSTAIRVHQAHVCARQRDVIIPRGQLDSHRSNEQIRNVPLSGQSTLGGSDPTVAGRTGALNSPRRSSPRRTCPSGFSRLLETLPRSLRPRLSKKLSYRRAFRRHYM